MKFEEFKTRIEEAYHQKFNKSYCHCVLSWVSGASAAPGTTISIGTFLARDASECPNGVHLQDCVNHIFAIHLPDTWQVKDDLPGEMKLRGIYPNIKVKPADAARYKCDFKDFPWQNVTGDAERLICAFASYTNRLYEMIKAEYEAGNLLENAADLIRKKGYFAR